MSKIRLFLVFISILYLVSCTSSPALVDDSDTNASFEEGSIVIEKQLFEFDSSLQNDSINEDEEENINLLATIYYPKIEGTIDNLKEINSVLRYVPFDIFGGETFDVEEMKKGNFVPLDKRFGFQATISFDYEVLYQDSNLISIEYFGTVSNAAHINTRQNYYTYNYRTCEQVSAEEFISIEEIYDRIDEGSFEVDAGHYLPGGWDETEPEIKQEFIASINNSISSSNGEPNSDSKYYLGITEDSILVRFPFYDSLNGYVILKFARADMGTASRGPLYL